MDLNTIKLNCPTSGVLLGAVVKSFELDDEQVGGPTAAFLGSDDNAGRTARRYFGGEPMPEDTRKEICKWAADALVHSGLLQGFHLPRRADGHNPQPAAYLAEILYSWLGMWDRVYHRAAEGWPHPPQSLGIFVLGRQAVIDLVIRSVAMAHLCGTCEPQKLHLFAPYEHPARDLLKYLGIKTGKEYSREKLAGKLGVEKTTVDSWMDDGTIPKRDNLWRLSKVFSSPECQQPQLLRWLRVQFGVIALGRRLCGTMNGLLASQLMYAFSEFTQFIAGFHGLSKLQRPLFLYGQREVLENGIWDPSSHHVLNGLLKSLPESDLPNEFWIDDITAAQAQGVERRLEACFSIIGDWPKDTERFNRSFPELPDEERRHQQVAMALFGMSDAMLARNTPEEGSAAEPEYWSYRAWHLIQAGRHGEAVPLLEKAIAADPEDPELRCYLGMALCRCSDDGRLNEGRSHLQQAARLRPGWSFPIAERARTHLERSEFEDALRCLDDGPRETKLRCNDCAFVRAQALRMLGRYPEALAAAEIAKNLDPGHADAWSLAADLAFLLEDRKKGQAYQKQALHLGLTTVRKSGIAYPNAICPTRTAAEPTSTTDTPNMPSVKSDGHPTGDIRGPKPDEVDRSNQSST